jgi:hypothetical protein
MVKDVKKQSELKSQNFSETRQTKRAKKLAISEYFIKLTIILGTET